jgi:hypothetical protein
MEDQKWLTEEEQQARREKVLSEVGTEPPCPWCGVPRVKRSDYIRCMRHGVNWSSGEDISKDPRLSRSRTLVIVSTNRETGNTARTAKNISEEAK